jgi:hypothetical protein
MDVGDVAPVEVAVAPLLRQHAFRSDVDASEHVAKPEPGSLRVEQGEDGVVGGNLAVRRRRLEERHLQVAELLPVDDVRVEVDAKRFQRFLDVRDRELRVPAVVEVHGEGAQAEILDEPGYIGTVDAAADADDAVVGLAAAALLHVRDKGV